MDKQQPVVESSRAWYSRTTKKALRSLVWATITATLLAGVLFVAVPNTIVLKAQIFNGAWTIPVYGGLWLASFILIFLIPQRELGFRSQECLERMEAKVSAFVDDAKLALADMRAAAAKVSARADAADIPRAIQVLENISAKLDGDKPRLDLLTDAERGQQPRLAVDKGHGHVA